MKNGKKIFVRAFLLSLNKKKLLLTFFTLLVVGVITAFCRVGMRALWLNIGLSLLPFFLGAMLLMPLGIVLVRYYHDEIKRGKGSVKEIVTISGELLISSTYLMLPPFLLFLLLWASALVTALMQEIPGLAVLLSFLPFLLTFAALLLSGAVLFLLFMAPAALGLSPRKDVQRAWGLVKRFKKDPVENLLFFGLALIPGALMLFFIGLTKTFMLPVELTTMAHLVSNFMMMIPLCAIMTFPTVFFFSMSAEAHAYLES